MTEVTELESGAHWRRNWLWTEKHGSYLKQTLAGAKRFVAHETWDSLRTDGPAIPPISDETVETQQISSATGLLAGVDRWGFVYGLLGRATSTDHVVTVETPSDHWSWCGDPKWTPRICLKKRMAILGHFVG